MDTVTIIVGLVTFNVGFLVGAFWVSSKTADAKESASRDVADWVRPRPY